MNISDSLCGKMNRKTNKNWLKAFFSGFIIFLICVAPVVIAAGGQYVSYGDYNVQIISFWEYICHNWKNGMPAIDFKSDLGMNYIAGYSFYGLTSPYTFISLLFPEKALPYAMTFVNALKFGMAAAGAYIYSARYLKKESSAYMCGMLYAFSGAQLFNMVYHFADSISLFPFLLCAFDGLIYHKKSLAFGLMAALCAFTNYYFFFGECVFIIIYFAVKIISREIKLTPRLFGKIAFEACVGTLLSAVILLPTFLYLRGNARATSTIFGKNLLSYEAAGTLWQVFRSMFFIPDSCANGIFFSDSQLDVASVSLYIPLFTVVGVAAVVKANRKSWYSILLLVCGVFAAIPLLNSAFSAFNSTYYARWFFMPMLVMITLTGKYIDNMEDYDIKTELKAVGAVVGIFCVYGIYCLIRGQMSSYMLPEWIFGAFFAVISLVLVYLLRYHKDGEKIRGKRLSAMVCAVCAVPFFVRSFMLVFYDSAGEVLSSYLDAATNNGQSVVLDDDSFFRVTTSSECDKMNSTINWGYPSVDFFHSLVSGSSTDFWALAGRPRLSNGDLDSTDYAACSFLSVKYDLYYNELLIGGIEVEPEALTYSREGFEQADVQNRYVIYNNECYIPMGYTFDYYINENEFEKYIFEEDNTKSDSAEFGVLETGSENEIDNSAIDYQRNEKLLLKAICLTDEQIEKYSDILQELPDSLKEDVSDEAYYKDCENRRNSAGTEFTVDGHGFTSKINLEKDNLVFYSVDYDEGYTAYVDGEQTDIEKVFGGLCAVKVPSGEHTVRFEYETPGLKAGSIISLASLGLFAGYAVLVAAKKAGQNKTEAER